MQELSNNILAVMLTCSYQQMETSWVTAHVGAAQLPASLASQPLSREAKPLYVLCYLVSHGVSAPN